LCISASPVVCAQLRINLDHGDHRNGWLAARRRRKDGKRRGRTALSRNLWSRYVDSFLSFSLSASALQGQSIAYAWYFAGCRTLDDIRERKGGIKLSSIQELGLKYYDGALSHPRDVTTGLSDLVITDINTRMPREEARVIFEEIRSIGKSSRWPSARIGVYDLLSPLVWIPNC